MPFQELGKQQDCVYFCHPYDSSVPVNSHSRVSHVYNVYNVPYIMYLYNIITEHVNIKAKLNPNLNPKRLWFMVRV